MRYAILALVVTTVLASCSSGQDEQNAHGENAHGDQAQKEIHHHDAPAMLGDEQMAKLDDAGRKQLLACQQDMAHDVWGNKQAAEEEIAYRIKQARKKGTTAQQEMWFAGYRCPEEIPGMEHMEVE